MRAEAMARVLSAACVVLAALVGSAGAQSIQ